MRTDTKGTAGLPISPTDADTTTAPRTRGHAEGRSRLTTVLWIVGTAAFVVFAIVALTLWAGDVSSPEARVPRSEPPVGSQEFLQRLADQGYIPQEAVDPDRLLLERLVDSGRIPAETLD